MTDRIGLYIIDYTYNVVYLSCYKETVVRKGWFSHAARHQEPASLTQRDDPSQHTHTYTSVEKGDGGGTAKARCQKPPEKSLAVWLNCRVHKCIVHVHIACDRQAYACWDFPIPPFSPPLLRRARVQRQLTCVGGLITFPHPTTLLTTTLIQDTSIPRCAR